MTNIQNNTKLSVDSYKELDNGTMLCQCFIVGGDDKQPYIEKTVSLAELKNKVADKNGRVEVTTDPENTVAIHWMDWYTENRHSEEVHDVLADIINARENRKELAAFPEVFEQMAKICQDLDMRNIPAADSYIRKIRRA